MNLEEMAWRFKYKHHKKLTTIGIFLFPIGTISIILAIFLQLPIILKGYMVMFGVLFTLIGAGTIETEMEKYKKRKRLERKLV